MENQYIFYRDDDDVVMRCSLSAVYNLILELKRNTLNDDDEITPERAIEELIKGEQVVRLTINTDN
jgi:hypothetical protein